MSSYGDGPVPSIDGGTDAKSGRRYRSVWGDVWQACQANGLSPTELVESRFAMALSAVPPEPKDLIDRRIVTAAVRRKAESPETTRRKLASQLSRLGAAARTAGGLRSADPVAEVAYSEDAYSNPLARYLFVLAAGRQDLAAVFFGEAAAELSLRRGALKDALGPAFGGHFPPDLIAAADRLLSDSHTRPDPAAPGGEDG